MATGRGQRVLKSARLENVRNQKSAAAGDSGSNSRSDTGSNTGSTSIHCNPGAVGIHWESGAEFHSRVRSKKPIHHFLFFFGQNSVWSRELPNCWIAKLPSCQVAELLNCREFLLPSNVRSFYSEVLLTSVFFTVRRSFQREVLLTWGSFNLRSFDRIKILIQIRKFWTKEKKIFDSDSDGW